MLIHNINIQHHLIKTKKEQSGEIGRSLSAGSLAKAQNAVMSPNSRLWPNPSPFRTLRASFTYDEHNNEVERSKKRGFCEAT